MLDILSRKLLFFPAEPKVPTPPEHLEATYALAESFIALHVTYVSVWRCCYHDRLQCFTCDDVDFGALASSLLFKYDALPRTIFFLQLLSKRELLPKLFTAFRLSFRL